MLQASSLKMLQVRPGLLLGSRGDALAVLSRVPSVTKLYTVTHVLTLANEPLEVEDGDGEEDDSGDGTSDESCKGIGGKKRRRSPPVKTMFVKVADMPGSDLLHSFEPCIQFIKEGVEQGTVLVHCEHGISRSVTVVLAYLMWSEGLPLRILFQNLKTQKPEIRPNEGFMSQLKLWEAMRCRIDQNNKSYRTYRLKHVAQEVQDAGYVENMAATMAPDPFTKQLDSTAYFRCRKCRRLLFTNESLLPHELGQGQAAFGRHKHSKPVEDSSTCRSVKDFSRGVGEGDEEVEQKGSKDDRKGSEVQQRSGVEGEGVELRSGEGEGVELRSGEREGVELRSGEGEGVELRSGESEGVELRSGEGEGMEPRNSGEGEGVELRGAGKGEESYVEPSLKNLSQENSDFSSSVANEHISSEHSNQVTAAERTMKGGSPTSPPPLTLDELARVRAQVASLATHSSPLTPHTCSSYFIEPVEWMEPTLLGHVEGKLLCPKCSARLGSFKWAGEQCSCGQWVTPSFQVHKSRVDEIRTLVRRKSTPGTQ